MAHTTGRAPKEPTELEAARDDLLDALAGTKEKVRDATGLKLRSSWVAPVIAGAAGLGLALLLRGRKRK